MEQRQFKRKKTWILVLFLALMILLRFALAAALGNTINSTAGYDDAWFVNASFLKEHFSSNSPWSMIKNPAFFIFLWLVRVSHLPLWFWTSLLWSLAAAASWPLLSKFTKNRIFLSLSFVFLLFCPVAFDARAGIKIYRSLFMAPWFCLFFESCLLLGYESWICKKGAFRRFCAAILLMALTLPPALLSKEDGIWLWGAAGLTLMLCLVGLIVSMVRSLRQNRALGIPKGGTLFMKGLMILLLLLPCLTSAIAEKKVRDKNEEAFGVDLVNWRTQGEIARFASLVYQIDSSKRDALYWADNEALEKAVAASPTLGENEALLEKIRHSPFYNLDEEQIAGDFLPWVVLSAFEHSGQWKDGKDAQDYFKKVNDEIETAFESGSLKKQKGRFFLSKSAGSRSFDEVLGVFPWLKAALEGSVFLDGYTVSVKPSISTNEKTFEKAQKTAHETLFADGDESSHPLLTRNRKAAGEITEWIFRFYSIANPLLLLAGFLFWCTELLLRIIRNRADFQIRYLLVSIFCLLGVFVVYLFAVCWFSEFIFRKDGLNDWARSILIYYGAGGISLQYLAELLAAALIYKSVRGFQKEKKTKKSVRI